MITLALCGVAAVVIGVRQGARGYRMGDNGLSAFLAGVVLTMGGAVALGVAALRAIA